jgi:hypothetical protein
VLRRSLPTRGKEIPQEEGPNAEATPFAEKLGVSVELGALIRRWTIAQLQAVPVP